MAARYACSTTPTRVADSPVRRRYQPLSASRLTLVEWRSGTSAPVRSEQSFRNSICSTRGPSVANWKSLNEALNVELLICDECAHVEFTGKWMIAEYKST